ncbi:MAG: hypothetical protein MHMPM18_001132 [Marteilia pararefringens]
MDYTDIEGIKSLFEKFEEYIANVNFRNWKEQNEKKSLEILEKKMYFNCGIQSKEVDKLKILIENASTCCFVCLVTDCEKIFERSQYFIIKMSFIYDNIKTIITELVLNFERLKKGKAKLYCDASKFSPKCFTSFHMIITMILTSKIAENDVKKLVIFFFQLIEKEIIEDESIKRKLMICLESKKLHNSIKLTPSGQVFSKIYKDYRSLYAGASLLALEQVSEEEIDEIVEELSLEEIVPNSNLFEKLAINNWHIFEHYVGRINEKFDDQHGVISRSLNKCKSSKVQNEISTCFSMGDLFPERCETYDQIYQEIFGYSVIDMHPFRRYFDLKSSLIGQVVLNVILILSIVKISKLNFQQILGIFRSKENRFENQWLFCILDNPDPEIWL